jgi:hypothetical protein
MGICQPAGEPQPAIWAGGREPLSSILTLQSDREEIRQQVELGEQLISRFRHWEPLLRECSF